MWLLMQKTQAKIVKIPIFVILQSMSFTIQNLQSRFSGHVA